MVYHEARKRKDELLSLRVRVDDQLGTPKLLSLRKMRVEKPSLPPVVVVIITNSH
jgi:hypothetical protein